MNKKRFYIISSTLLLIGLFAGVVQYVGMFDALYAAATNPGHSWSQMECSEDLCIDAANHKVTIKNLKISGLLYDKSNSTGQDGSNLRMTVDGPIWDPLLTWPGSTHTVTDCTNANGVVYNTGTVTICKFQSATVPSGWRQAGNWQRYSSASWGGDACGHFLSSGPAIFANQSSLTQSMGTARYVASYVYCQDIWASSHWHTGSSTEFYDVVTSNNGSVNRIEIGAY